MEPLRFIGVGDLLEDIGRGLGTASAELVRRSGSPVGTLAVKTADVTVSFELTSAATSRTSTLSADPGAFVLGAKTVTFGTTSFAETQTNRCTIALHIVSVAAPFPPDSTVTPAASSSTAEKQRLTGLLDALKAAAAANTSLTEAQHKVISEELAAIDGLLAGDQLTEARGALAIFAASHLKNLNMGD